MTESDFSGGDLSGRVVDRRFEVVDKLGEGGMGAIYRAKQLSVNRMVALKLLLRDRRGDPISAERFKHEAYLASRLRHPNAVVIYDFGQAEDGLLYIAMELLAGQNLKECMQKDAPLGDIRGSKIMLQTLRPIAQAHGMGLVHRDLKPANIFLTDVEGDKDFVKVLDFGVAKLTAVQDSVEGYQGGLTVAGKIYGTPNYMSPEQIRGKDVDQLSDLYSLGVIYYEMLCGRRPFEAETPVDVMMMHLRDVPEPPSTYLPGIPPAADAVALKALAKEPKDRYASAEAFIEALLSLGVSSGAFGALNNERGEVSNRNITLSNRVQGKDGSADHELQDVYTGGDEVSITGLGFDDDDFGDEYNDEKTVLEVDESVEVDFSVSVSDIESESLDLLDSEQDTLFQSAADDSIKALFDHIEQPDPVAEEKAKSAFEEEESSQLDALDVDGDEFGADEPSRLVPIPQAQIAAARTTVNSKPAGLNSGKRTMMGYPAKVLDEQVDKGRLESPFAPSSPSNPQMGSTDPVRGTPELSPSVTETRLGNPQVKLPEQSQSATSGPISQPRDIQTNPVVESAVSVPQRRADFDANTKTPNPGNVESWAAAFDAAPKVGQTGPRFAMPASEQNSGWLKWALVAAVIVVSGLVGSYFAFLSEPQSPPTVTLTNIEDIIEKYDVYVGGNQLVVAQPTLKIMDAEEKEALVRLKADRSKMWAFTLPTIAVPHEILLRLKTNNMELGRVRLKGSTPGSLLEIDGLPIKAPWVMIVGSVGTKLKAVRNGTEKEIEIFKGDALQEIRDF